MGLPTDCTIDVWVQLVRAHKAAVTAVESRLKKADLPPLDWYDILVELDRADAMGLRHNELQERLLLPQYGVSRLLERMERAGYVGSVVCPSDSRCRQITLTAAGRKLRKRMWAIYGPAIERALGGRFSKQEVGQLSELLRRVHTPAGECPGQVVDR